MLEYLQRFLQRKAKQLIPPAPQARSTPGLPADQVRDAVLFVGLDGRIKGANQAAVNLYGYTREELLSLHIHDLRAPETTRYVQAQMQQAYKDGLRFETAHLRKDGTSIYVEVTSNAVTLDSDQVLLSIIRDISHRKRRESIHSLLRELDQRLLQGEPLDRILNPLCEQLTTITGASVAWIALKNLDGLTPILARGGKGAFVFDKTTIRWDHSPEGLGPTGQAIRTGMPQVVDVIGNPDLSPWREQFQTLQVLCGVAVPLNSVQGTLGALTLYSERHNAFDEEAVADLVCLADEIAISLLAAEGQEQIRVQRAALEASSCAMVIAGEDGHILWVNSAWSHLTGYTASEARGQSLKLLESDRQDPAVAEARWQAIHNGQSWKGQVFSRRKDGSVFVDEQIITPVKDERGSITHIVAVMQDVTDRVRQEDRLRYMALHDPQTGAPNSRALRDRLDEAISRTPQGFQGALLLINFDHFRLVNETMGHTAGNAILGTAASIMRQLLAPADMLARWDSDQFCALLEDVTPEEAVATADRIRDAIRQHRFVLRDRALDLTVSIGAVPIHTLLDQESLFTLAEWALSEAKQLGRDRTVLHRFEKLAAQ